MSTQPPDADPSEQNNAGDSDDAVHTYATFDDDGRPFARVTLTPDSDKRTKYIYFDTRPPIPVIFIPGVMGSLLVDKNTGRSIWAPPNTDAARSTVAAAATIIGDYFQSAATREKRFDPTTAVVDPSGPVVKFDEKKLRFNQEEARRRGWSTVHRTSYQHTLAWLQDMLDHPMRHGNLHDLWTNGDPKGKDFTSSALFGTQPSQYGAHGANAIPITKDSEEFKSFIKFRYPVYAIGYNFLQSNEVSAKQVLDGLDYTLTIGDKTIHRHIMGIREICRECKTDKAIIITHSMGGLVARMASQFCNGAKDMLGVIHTAQPATGAPLFAKRFRTGGEDFINKSLLGRNDAEFVAIAANAEGPMELAPMPDYHDGQPWWIFADNQGNECMCLPRNDALSELYINDAWYGLLPDNSLLDPAGIVKKRLEDERSTLSVHENYKMVISKVVERQNRLSNNYHPNTYAMYGNGALSIPTPADAKIAKLETWGNVIWRGNLPEGTTEADLKTATPLQDNHHGVITITVRGQTVKLTAQSQATAPKLDQPDNGITPGDGTVPAWSAEAQGRGLLPGSKDKSRGVQMIFTQGGYEHQFCLKHPWTRWSVVYSIIQIVHTARERITCP
jgi:hypothetical protein